MDEKEKLFLELIDGFKWRYDLDKNINSLLQINPSDRQFNL